LLENKAKAVHDIILSKELQKGNNQPFLHGSTAMFRSSIKKLAKAVV